jgi:hypothetical protein
MAQEAPKAIYLVCVMVEDDGSLAECSAIKYQDMLWLVPKWIDSPSEGTTQPERIICMDGQPYQPGGRIGEKIFDYTLNRPIPTAVLYGPDPSQAAGGFVVELIPDIKLRRRTDIH